MAISLKDLRKVRATQPPRVLIYGPYGQGKTTLAAEFPNPVFIQIEDGTTSDMEIDSFGQISSFDQVLEGVGALYTEEHAFKTLVIDSLDKLEPLIWAAVCADNHWESIETPGYGKGYVMGDRYWQNLLEGLAALRRDLGMAIVLISHSEVERFDDPQTMSYSRYDLHLHKRARALIGDEMDAILFVNQEAQVKSEEVGHKKTRQHAEGGGTRWIYAEGRPSFAAKNRYGMPPKLLFKKGAGYSAIAPYFPSPAPTAPDQATA